MNRLEGPYDAALHLLDRQIVDSEGLLVAKVDDVALTPDLEVAGLLVGTAALLPRLGGRLGPRLLDLWERLAPAEADRGTPRFIPIRAVVDVGSAVTLGRARLRLLDVHEPPGHRLGQLLDLPVVAASGRSLGRVIDVRLTEHGEVHGLVVGRGGPGSLLGYDRNREQGPRLVAAAVSWLHRHSGYAARADVAEIEWGHRVRLRTDRLDPLRDVYQ
ncbi:PRC-barrel domain-containing protein [Nocardioides terrae]|uniref:PRC-barrel domain-containing protein n=1 Tax=Nocardioides terrae TaxID=574651 RepID=A0A1I1MGB9_9ACTN|nr:PRC-barrel domain-containing protein [Nocardioides terrae]SFC84186.1 PRC-barrel domain-containing protein [Nocardioides terrae]